jgi:hypothetical protein
MKHILLFGNGPEINNIDFESLDYVRNGNSDIVTAGVNRIWRRYMPDYFFFIDGDIVRELIAKSVQRPEGSEWFSSDFLFKNEGRPGTPDETEQFYEYFQTNSIHLLPRPWQHTRRLNSMLWSIIYLNKFIFFKEKCRFYLFATPLRIVEKDDHHFWAKDTDTIYQLTPDRMEGYFRSHVRGLQELSSAGYDIYSATADSLANNYLQQTFSICPYELVRALSI